MKKISLFLLPLLIAFASSYAQRNAGARMVASYFKAKEEGRNVRFYQSWHLGIMVPLENSCDFSWTYWNRAEDGTYLGKGSHTRTFKNNAIIATGSVYFPLFEISETTALAFNIGVVGYGTTTEMLGDMKINNNTYNSSFASVQFGLPLALDFKYGGEALNDKAERVSFTLGAGICPMLYASAFSGFSSVRGNFRPYIHGEIGIFAGIEWKFKVDYMAKSAEIMRVDYRDVITMPEGSLISVTNKPMLSVGIALMPFSYDWENSRW